MDIDTGIHHALKGDAILFVGSGFSRNAINSLGEKLKTGEEFSKYLLDGLCIQEKVPLRTASSIFFEKKGVNELYRILRQEFKIKSITNDQKILLSIPWKRIYTTNYDDVVERGFIENNKTIDSVILQDSCLRRGTFPLCIHINGYVDKINKDSFNHDIRLTEESYDSDTIKSSEWLDLLRGDIKLSNAVFFVGCGLDESDIELRWLLNESEENKEKTFFITAPNPTFMEERRIRSFGQLHAIGLEGLVHKINLFPGDKFLEGHIQKMHFGSSFSEYKGNYEFKKTTNDDIFNLFCYGKIDENLIKNGDYFLRRNIVSKMLGAISEDSDVLVVHSDIGDGKQICLRELALKAIEKKFRVFELENINCDTSQEFNAIQQIAQSQKCIIIINKFTHYYDNIVQLLKMKEDNVIIVFSARTPSYEVFISKINHDFKNCNIVTFNISQLDKGEILWLVKTFRKSGLLGCLAAKDDDALKFLFAGRKCNSKISSILLTIFEQPEVGERIRKEYDLIKSNDNARKILISLYILSLLECPRVYETLVKIWGISKFNDNILRSSTLRNFINFDAGKINTISSAFSRYIINNEEDDFILKLLTNIFLNIYKIKELKKLKKDLMTYGKLTKLFSKERSNYYLAKYYDYLKDKCSDEVLFWLQYAICMMMNKNYDQADVYFSTAYSLATSRQNFNPFQINNSYERFLLLRSLTLNFEDAYDNFIKAHEMIVRDFTDQDDEILKFYPYRNMILYKDFWHHFNLEIKNNCLTDFQHFIQDAARMVGHKKYYKSYIADIEQCYNCLTEILNEIVV